MRVTLGDHVDILTGFPFRSRAYSESGARLLRGDNIGHGRLRWQSAKHWPEDQLNDFHVYELAPGDIVLAMDRPWIAAGLKYAWLSSEDLPCLLVQRVARMRARAGLSQSFLRYLISSRPFVGHVLSVQTGTTVPHISAAQIREFSFLLPTMREQRAIAEVLGPLDDKIEGNARLVPLLRDLAVALLQREADPATVFRVADVADVRKGLSYTGAGLADTGMPMANLANAANFGWLKRSGFKHYTGAYKLRHVAPPGALLVSGVDLTWRLDIIGWPMLLPDDVGPALFSHHVFVVDFRDDNAWLRLPLWAHLYTSAARQRLESMVYGTTVATLPTEALAGLTFPALPPGSPVLDAAEHLVQRAWAAERETAQLAALRDALLPPLLDGRLRVSDAVMQASEHV